MTYAIRNWHKFQHFKDRRPPWIKLYRDILDDPDWHDLDGDAAKALVMFWLIASENDGKLPDSRNLAFRLRIPEKRVIQLLGTLSQWLVQDDIASISPEYRDDAPETERETYREETEKKAPDGADDPVTALMTTIDEEKARAVVEHRKRMRKPLTAYAAKLLAGQLAACPDPNAAADTMIASGWQGIKPEWVAGKTPPAKDLAYYENLGRKP